MPGGVGPGGLGIAGMMTKNNLQTHSSILADVLEAALLLQNYSVLQFDSVQGPLWYNPLSCLISCSSFTVNC